MSKNIMKPLLAVVAVVALTGALVYGGFAAFTAATSNTGSTTGTGNLAFNNDATGSIFTVSNMKPGDHFTRQITVTNDGTVDAEVQAALATTGDLASSLEVTVSEDVEGSVATSDTSGNITWTYGEAARFSPWAPGADHVFTISYLLPQSKTNAVANKSASADLTFAAQSIAGKSRTNGSTGVGTDQ